MTEPEIRMSPDADSLAAAVAEALVERIVAAQAERGIAHVVLTGGGIGTATLAAVPDAPGSAAVDWSAVEVWWGDERFVPSGDAERNESGARTAFLDRLPLDPARVHPMPSTDDAPGPAAAAASYAADLAAAAAPGSPVPAFDVLMLGVGPEGHVASLFPGLPGVHEAAPVVAVLDSPKPPPTRISLSFPSLRAAREVWLIAAGEGKAAAMAAAASPGTSPFDVPAAGARGQDRTIFWLDAAAGARLGPIAEG
ncbi:MAG: 6-phosphogluconolactonase [bacterium]